MKSYKLKTENKRWPIIIIEATNILEAINNAMGLYHGLIEEEIISAKLQLNYKRHKINLQRTVGSNLIGNMESL